ncbi:hypothetical protein PMAYCL1PPCAC_29229, partial [Pristionchus mayeri]
RRERERGERRMSLDQTLENINTTLEKVHGLLEVVQMAIIIVAVALAVLLIGMTITCYYGKYKKYNTRRDSEHGSSSESRVMLLTPPGLDKNQYQKGKYHPNEI